MKRILLCLGFLIPLLGFSQEGCLNATYGQYPTATYQPSCVGIPLTITSLAYAGEYSLVQLTADENYEFSSSIPSDFITISDETGSQVLAYGTGSVSYMPSSDGLYRFYTHADDQCTEEAVLRSRLISCGEAGPAPANDNCSDITPAELAAGETITFNGTTVGGTASTEESNLFGDAVVWEAVTLTSECSDLTIDYCGTPAGNMSGNFFIVYTDCPTTTYEIGNYDFTTCSDGNGTLRFYGLPAGDYYLPVIVDPSSNTLGDYVMNVTATACAGAPANDDCENAIALACGDTISGSTVTATDSGGSTPANDVFFTYTGSGVEEFVTISLCGSSYDTYLSIYSDCSLSELLYSNDDSSSCGGLQSEIRFTSDGASVYYILVEGYDTSVGHFELSVTCEEVGEPSEGCLNADYGQYPAATFTPSCIGIEETISAYAYAGEFSLVQVTAGTDYVFSSNLGTDFLTIADELGESVLAYGTATVSWTADADRLVRFYTHADAYCSPSEDMRARIVQCGEVPEPPANDSCSGVTPTTVNIGETATFTGTTLGGTADEYESTIFGYPAVWEAVTLTGDCNNLTVDYCGTAPGIMDLYFVIFTDSCSATDFTIGTYDNATCADGNATIRFRNLPAGTYYLPVLSSYENNTLGDYVMNVTVEECLPPPVECSDFFVNDNNLENGYSFESSLAVDLPLQETAFDVYGVDAVLIGEASLVTVTFYNDADGYPGTEITSVFADVVATEVIGNNFGFDFVNNTLQFVEPVSLDANTTYWMQISSDALYWDFSSLGEIGRPAVEDAGDGWGDLAGEFVFDLICEPLAVTDVSTQSLQVYPNPVTDFLNINANQNIDKVALYNANGQLVKGNTQLIDGKVDMRSLPTGVYVIKIQFDDAKTRSFKVIKK